MGEKTTSLLELLMHNVNTISFLGYLWPEKQLLPLPFGITALFCSSLYMINWQFDPCGQYQIEKTKASERSSKEIMSKKAITLTRKHFVDSAAAAANSEDCRHYNRFAHCLCHCPCPRTFLYLA